MTATSAVGWHHFFGELLVVFGVSGTIIISFGALRRDSGRGSGRR
jgi:hypothetical protein